MITAQKNNILDAVMGLCVGDALGVPVEFMSRDVLKANPVVGMREYGTHHQKAGTWSDDTSLTLCLVDVLIDGPDYKELMNKFRLWLTKAKYTPHGEVFDAGIATRQAIQKYTMGVTPLQCGGSTDLDNGNGSLMRILPLLFYLQTKYGQDFASKEEAWEVIHNVSSLTHAHRRSQIACGIYIQIASMLDQETQLLRAVQLGIQKAKEFYSNQPQFQEELKFYSRLLDADFKATPESKIRSSGYVVDTLEASIWCLLNTQSYKECVLKAVNLGDDTDTVAAVAGGLAGVFYGYKSIPGEWIECIARKEYIYSLCNTLKTSLEKMS